LISEDRLARSRVVDGRNGRNRLAAIAHLVARERMLAARDWQHAKGPVAIGAVTIAFTPGSFAASDTSTATISPCA